MKDKFNTVKYIFTASYKQNITAFNLSSVQHFPMYKVFDKALIMDSKRNFMNNLTYFVP